MADKIIEDVEVLDVKDMERNQRERRGAPVVWKALSIIVALVAAAYTASPIDAVPDAIPVLGWLDDIGFVLMAALNVYQQFAKDQNSTMVKLIRYTKWMLVALIILAGVVVGGLITLIIHLVMQA
ncbi:MAG: DUF1232 domain-containing protein [Fibrobacter sp.]|nr:DUF1232 domain-containing protein [Fibrobacter sp.]